MSALMHTHRSGRFNSAKALFSSWSSYNLYGETLKESFEEAAHRHFATLALRDGKACDRR